MRSIIVLAVLMLTLLLEFAGAGVLTKTNDPHDFCAGYAICR
jgi:hypothetical protein